MIYSSPESLQDSVLAMLVNIEREMGADRVWVPTTLANKELQITEGSIAISDVASSLVGLEYLEYDDGLQAKLRITPTGRRFQEAGYRFSTEDRRLPAWDRIVRLPDNDEAVRDIREQASDFARCIRSTNDAGQMSAEEMRVASMEADQLVAALNQPVVRSSTIASMAKAVLRWVGEKAAGAAVGTAATTLLTLLASYFGFPS